ncbi:hypothetical protein AFK24_09585 [Pseudomonas syringae]|uniref:Phage tail protein n=1 Tax=Pseudomonas syringae TaxID=317 RepID=A0A1C7Z5V7_PSESX|nr:hypothetical protein [Pseudomonas syringae]OCR25311.1 hypothetical protein AFK24_09585 [Pseudomonas syringae]
MQKISDSTSTANALGEFTEGNPGAGVDATLLKAPWLNSLQRELINAIEGLGGELDPTNDQQLLEAIKQIADDVSTWEKIKNIPPALPTLSRIVNISSDTRLSAHQMGLVLIDAEDSTRAITLPPTSNAGVADIIVFRVDNSGYRLVVNASSSDSIRFHTHLNPNGYPFLVLMGAGDWWHLRSDAKGNWWPIGRYDSTSLGRPVMETTIAFPPGGYGALNGALLSRVEWPWLWDHAGQSGMLVTEAERVGNEGAWTSGIDTLTFRSPEVRGEMLRILDENRGVDNDRRPGSWQDGTWIRTVAQEWTGSDISTGIHQIGTAYASADGHIKNGGPGGALPPGALAPSGEGPFPAVVSDNTIQGTATIDTKAVNNWIRLRVRNIAYPGRFKMI